MIWLYFTLSAYLFNAFAFVIDKYLLANHIPRPYTYAFWVSVLSASAVVLIPFGVSLQSAEYFLISFLSGGSFFVALIFLYKTIKKSDISVASTMAGVATAVFSYFLAVIFINEPSGILNVVAITFLITGMLFLGKTDKNIWRLAVFAGFFFSISFVFMKISFDLSDFVNGLFWTRVGLVGTAFASFIFTRARNEIYKTLREARPKVGAIFIGNKVLSAIGFLLLYYAIRLGEVSVVNSLLGFQFLFVFIIALLFRSKIPHIEENIDRRNIIQKILGISFVMAGFILVLLT